MSRKLLLTGASGFLGWQVVKANPGWDIVGLVHTRQAQGITNIQTDLTDLTQLRQILETEQPDAILHLAAESDVNKCQQYPDDTARLNVAPCEVLATYAAAQGIPLVYTSTDMVFDGVVAHYVETDRPSPINVYGSQKLAGEERIKALHPKACICRMPLMFGEDGTPSPRFLKPFLNWQPSMGSLTLFDDEYRSIAGGFSAARGLWLAIEQKWAGIYHMGGPQKLSRYDFGQLVNTIYGFNISIKPGKQSDVQMLAPRPADLELNSTKAFGAGYQPLLVEHEMQLMQAGKLYA